MSLLNKIKSWAKALKDKLILLHLASKHTETPWYVKLIILLILAYALSPIDLIPDFIPIIGYLDDLILLPLGIYVAFKLIPENIIKECHSKAKDYKWNRKNNWIIGGIIVIAWLFLGLWIFKTYFYHKN